MRTARLAATLGLLAACVPADQPPWLIDHPLPWGIVASVVQPGPYSSEIVVPEGRVRASALPLDTLELRALVVAPPDTPPLPPPIWVVCAGGSVNCRLRLQGAPPPACPAPLPLSQTEPCRLGDGERTSLTLGGVFTADSNFSGTIQLIAVGSGDPDLSSETCLERLSTAPLDGLQRCLIQTRTLELGPAWQLLRVAPELAHRYLLEIPIDWRDEGPDVHPVLLHATVVRHTPGGSVEVDARDGDTVTVRVGERVAVTAVFADDAAQDYYRFQPVPGDNLYRLEPAEESLTLRVALTELVDDERLEGNLTRSFVVPDVPGPVFLHAYVTDGRQGRATGTLRFLVERPTGAP